VVKRDDLAWIVQPVRQTVPLSTQPLTFHGALATDWRWQLHDIHPYP
jgi:hypothetical protein